jgi:hypothetical protein
MALPATVDGIWPYIERWPFAVIGFVTPGGEPRAAGVMYKVKDRELYVVTGFSGLVDPATGSPIR